MFAYKFQVTHFCVTIFLSMFASQVSCHTSLRLRAVLINRSNNYEQLLHRTNLHTLNDRRLQDIAILMYKVKHNLAPKYIQDQFYCKSNMEKTHSLRNSDFRIARFNTVTYGKHSVRQLGPLIYSKLTNKERGIPNLNAFKKAIKRKDLTAFEKNATYTVAVISLGSIEIV